MSEFWTTEGYSPLAVRPASTLYPVHSGKVFIVTGAAGGIGSAIVKLLVGQGARLAIWDLDEPALAQVAGEYADAQAVFPVTCDLGNEQSVRDAVAASEAHFGRLDGIVNNAAIVVRGDPLEVSWDDWQKVMAVNVQGAYLAATLVAKAMIAQGIRGAIVNVASEAGKKGHTQSLVYSSSKAALICMTRILAVAMAPHDINVNSVCPGAVGTGMLRLAAANFARLKQGDTDEILQHLVPTQMRRHITPNEVARTISFLLSDDALIIRGQAVNTDGGDTPY